MGLSEVRRYGNKMEEYDDFILCHIGQTPGLYGVGFMIKKYLKQSIESFTGISERVALLNMSIGERKMSSQVYAPTEAAKKEEINDFYENVSKAIQLAHMDYILMGDFNAKIGQPRKDEYLVAKQNGYGERNERGQKLIDFACENKLSIMNTFFAKKPKDKWTWRSPNKQYRNEIDFILTNLPGMFQNIEILNINYPSDHRPVRATDSIIKHKKVEEATQTTRLDH